MSRGAIICGCVILAAGWAIAADPPPHRAVKPQGFRFSQADLLKVLESGDEQYIADLLKQTGNGKVGPLTALAQDYLKNPQKYESLAAPLGALAQSLGKSDKPLIDPNKQQELANKLLQNPSLREFIQNPANREALEKLGKSILEQRAQNQGPTAEAASSNPSPPISNQLRGVFERLTRPNAENSGIETTREPVAAPAQEPESLGDWWGRGVRQAQHALNQDLSEARLPFLDPTTLVPRMQTESAVEPGRTPARLAVSPVLTPPPQFDVPKNEMTERLLTAVQKLQDLGGPFADSQALRNIARRLQANPGGRSSWASWLSKDLITNQWTDELKNQIQQWRGKLPQWSRSGRAVQRRFNRLVSWLPTVPKPNLPKIRMPSMSMPSVSTPRFSAPGLRAPSAPTSGSVVSFLVLAAIAVAAAVLLARGVPAGRVRLAQRQTERAIRRRLADPSLSDRDRVCLLFEETAIGRLGEEVGADHHRAIAQKLGGNVDWRSTSARRLADLYEQARYTPLDEPLPGDALAEARRHQAVLASKYDHDQPGFLTARLKS